MKKPLQVLAAICAMALLIGYGPKARTVTYKVWGAARASIVFYEDGKVKTLENEPLPWTKTMTATDDSFSVGADSPGVRYSLTIDGKELCADDDKKFPAQCACGTSDTPECP